MTKDLKTIDLNLLSVETLGEMAHEAAEQVEKNAKATVQKAIDCGRYLTAIKEQLEHGEWGAWLVANWKHSQSLAVQYMRISNSQSSANLTEATSINDALRIISDSKPETVPRSQRKTGQVQVGQTDVPAETEVDDDPTPDPPTQRKTAKGSEKVSEDKKPRTQQVVPEILPDEPKESFSEERTLSDWSVAEMLSFLKSSADDPKKRAKELRKVADELDPPKSTKFRPPCLEEVIEFASNKGWIGFQAKEFLEHYTLADWKYGKAKTPIKNWEIAASKAWSDGTGWASGKGNGHDSADRNGRGNNRNTTARAKTAPVDESKIRYV